MVGGKQAEAGSWDALPADLLAEVLRKFLHGDVQSISSVRQTCRAWRDAVRFKQPTLKPKSLHQLLGRAFPNLHALDLRTCTYQPCQLMWLSQLNGLKSLSLQLSGKDAVDQIAHFPGLALTSLELSGSSGKLREGLLELKKCTSLRKLDLSACELNVPAGTLAHVLWNLTRLEHLVVEQSSSRCDQFCQVDDELCEALGRMPGLAHLEMQQSSNISAQGLKRLERLKHLETLRLGPCPGLLDCSVQSLCCHTQLKELDVCFGLRIPYRQITGDMVAAIFSLPNLASLRIAGFDTSNLGDLPSLRGPPTLKHVSISQVTDSRGSRGIYKLLRSVPLWRLNGLHLNQCGTFWVNMVLVPRATELRALTMSECPHVHGTDLQQMSGLSKLESLVLDHSHTLSLHKSEWDFLPHLPGLTELSWAAQKDYAMPFDQNVQSLLEHATALKRLQRLNLRGHFLGGEVAGIAALTSLTELDISARSWSSDAHDPASADAFNAGLAHLACLTRLQRLDVARTAVNEEGLRGMCAGLKELSHLDLSGTAVEDEALRHLALLPNLETLRINDQPALADISDEGLAEVSRMRALRCLEARGNHSITAAGLKHLTALTGLAHLDVNDCASINPKKALNSLQGCTALRELRLGSAHSVCHAEPCREPPRVREADVAAFRARMPFLHTLTLAPHHVMPDSSSKAVVGAAIVGVEECIVWIVLKWLSIRGSAQKLIKTLRTSV